MLVRLMRDRFVLREGRGLISTGQSARAGIRGIKRRAQNKPVLLRYQYIGLGFGQNAVINAMERATATRLE